MSLKSLIKNLFFKKRYMYVEKCPRCGSPKTGYILNSFGTIKNNLELEKIKRLMNGEIVELHNFIDDEEMLFCDSCKIQWHGQPEVRYLTQEEILEQMQLRGIDDEYIYQRNNTFQGRLLMHSFVKQKKKEEKRKKRSEKKVKVKTVKKEEKATKTKQPKIKK